MLGLFSGRWSLGRATTRVRGLIIIGIVAFVISNGDLLTMCSLADG